MTNFWQAVEQLEEQPTQLLEYRLYYNDLGEVEFYSMGDEPGNYIIIDSQTYNEGRYDLKVIDKKIVKPTEYKFQKLIPATHGTETLDSDVSIVGVGQKWKLKRYE